MNREGKSRRDSRLASFSNGVAVTLDVIMLDVSVESIALETYVKSPRKLSGSAIGSRCGVNMNAGADLEEWWWRVGANLASRSFVNSNKMT